MKVKNRVSKLLLACAFSLAAGSVAQAQAVSYTGTIEVIEVWRNGNVAFRLNGVSSSCATGNWIVLNKSADGTKNMYATLLAAKVSGKQVRVYSSGCAPAENYGSTPYVQVDYLYLSE